MAKASFFANHLKVRRKGKFLIIEARRICQHGTVFDEIFLTVPAELAHLFTSIEQAQNSTLPETQNNNTNVLAERFRRFHGDN